MYKCVAIDVHQHLGHNYPLWWLPSEETEDIKSVVDELRQRTVIPETHDNFEVRWTEVLDKMAREKAAYLYEQSQARVEYLKAAPEHNRDEKLQRDLQNAQSAVALAEAANTKVTSIRRVAQAVKASTGTGSDAPIPNRKCTREQG